MLFKLSILSVSCVTFFVVITTSAPVDVNDLNWRRQYLRIDYHPHPKQVYHFGVSKSKRQTSNVLKLDRGDLVAMQNSPQKLKDIINMMKNGKKSGIFTLNGWSASGMPFNVLYSPNSVQQKFLAALNAVSIKNQSSPREDYVTERKDVRVSGLKTSTQSPQARRHYLVIPQLFVSYGWSPAGK